MSWRYYLMRLGVASLLPALAGCSMPVPTYPDRLGTTGVDATGTLLNSSGARPPFVFPDGCCYYNDRIVRTVVPPASSPRTGRDNFYAITNGVAGQKDVVGVAPGDTDYHGGHWKFHAVMFTVAPYLLTSEAAVLAAESAGDVTITRDPDADFKCPIQL